MGRRMGRKFLSLFVLTLLGIISVCGSHLCVHAAERTASEAEDAVSFQWAFGALTGSEENRKLEAITKDTTLKGGDQIKMLVELQTKCFVYVIHQGPQGQVRLLFPYNLQQFASDYELAKKYTIPRGDVWIALDASPGTETLHLLASAQRLGEIEKLWSQHEAAEDAHRTEIAKLLLAEVRNVKKQHRDLSGRVERPVAIGGAIRGIQKPSDPALFDIASLALEISSPDFYARTFTIDHQ